MPGNVNWDCSGPARVLSPHQQTLCGFLWPRPMQTLSGLWPWASGRFVGLALCLIPGPCTRPSCGALARCPCALPGPGWVPSAAGSDNCCPLGDLGPARASPSTDLHTHLSAHCLPGELPLTHPGDATHPRGKPASVPQPSTTSTSTH